MLCTTSIFILLSIFYYEYVDPAVFDNVDENDSDDEKSSMKKSNRSSVSSKSSKASSMHKSTRLTQVSPEFEDECEF